MMHIRNDDGVDSPPPTVQMMETNSDEGEEHGAGETVSTLASADHATSHRHARPATISQKQKLALPKKKKQPSMLQLYERPNETPKEAQTKILRKLQGIYKYRILPLEKQYQLNAFCLPTKHSLRDEEFEANPMVLLLGPYSTGKTTFIRHTLGCDFPGLHIGPEPTSDKFMAIFHGGNDSMSFNEKLEDDDDDEGGKIIKGNTLTVTPELPFGSLSSFGSAFLNHFNGSISNSSLLRKITIIDTPGVLSGEKQRSSRDYDFAQAAKWFADRSDLILLLFDAHKLDFSDELKDVVETIRPHNDDKIRCVLNKCDGIEKDQLVRVYGSLMWSLGKLLSSPEVTRVYTGSYWDEPLVCDDFKVMFDHDEKLLMQELVNLPSTCAERKVNAMVKRIRLVKVHLCILGYLGEKMPRYFGMARAREQMIKNLDQIFDQVAIKYDLSKGDMPTVDEFRKCLENFEDFTIFPIPEQATLQKLDDLIEKDIPALMKGSGIISRAGGGKRGAAMSGAAKGKLRFLYELGFSMPTEDRDLDEEDSKKKSSWIIVRVFWLLLILSAIFGGIYYGLVSADMMAPIAEWQLPPLPSVSLPQMPELSIPEFTVPEFKMSSFIYIGGALFFLMLHFLLRTSRV